MALDYLSLFRSSNYCARGVKVNNSYISEDHFGKILEIEQIFRIITK